MVGSTIRLDGHVTLVTGGTRGIGRGIAEAFLAAGSKVAVCGRNAPEKPVASGANQATFYQADIRDPEQAFKLVEQVVADHGKLDSLINNAGGSPKADSATASPRFMERIVALNLMAPIYMMQAANKAMQTQDEGGAIVNIASVSGVRPSPGTSAYGAAKAGLLHVTTSLAMEWGPKVRVNAIICGLVATEAAGDHYGTEGGVSRIGQMLPLKRMGTPADIAAACLYLSSPLSVYVSGAHLAVHGGGERPIFLDLAGD